MKQNPLNMMPNNEWNEAVYKTQSTTTVCLNTNLSV